MLRIGIIAGEASGDLLGADLICAIRKHNPDIEVIGIGGERLIEAGCQSLYPMERLSVMGISEIFSRYFELLNIRRRIKQYFMDNPPDIFIGVDAPDFNFPIEKVLHNSGIKTIHYVSPSIWAWREYRLKSIAQSIDLMLTLFPFEHPYYEKYGIPVRFVGHPLAKKINIKTDKSAARTRLHLPMDKNIIAIMPGSRSSELNKLIEPFLHTANWCSERTSHLHFVTNLVNENAKNIFMEKIRKIAPEIQISIFTGQSLDVLEAADVILLASGTIALEAMLLKRPMVVAYKVSWLTYQIAKRLIRIPYVSLPNILAGRRIVPEYIQYDCRPEIMGPAILKWLNDKQAVADLVCDFTEIHQKIQPPPDQLIAKAVLDIINCNA